jgi:hypothetical protein
LFQQGILSCINFVQNGISVTAFKQKALKCSGPEDEVFTNSSVDEELYLSGIPKNKFLEIKAEKYFFILRILFLLIFFN